MLEVRLFSKHIALSLVLFFLVTVQVSYLVSGSTQDDELQLLEDALIAASVEDSDNLPTDKRYARLSYSYGGNRNRGRNNYYNRRYYGRRYYRNYYKPWLNLPDKQCFRQRCSADTDCCRLYSKCDKSAKLCYNCWRGHPCKTSRDCCERYPYCDRQFGTCQ